jgi:hypothetical protein
MILWKGSSNYGRLARSDEHSPGVAIPGSESGHALQICRIPAFKLGNRWRFKKSKLDQWMEEKSNQMETKSKKKPKAAVKAAGQL